MQPNGCQVSRKERWHSMYSTVMKQGVYSRVDPRLYINMKKEEPPEPPDPYAVSAAQTDMNKQTAGYEQKINMIDQYTPTGSLVYSKNANDPERWTSTSSLTPEAQKAHDLQQQVTSALSGVALKTTGQLKDALGKPLDFGKSNVTGDLKLKPFNANGLPKGPQTLDLSSLGEMPQGLDYSSLGNLPNAPQSGDVPQWDEAARQKAEDAMYGLQTSKMDPFYERDRIDMENRLINSGLQKGTPGYDQQVEQWTRSRDEAYQNARKTSIAGSTDFGTASYGASLAGNKEKWSQMLQQVAAELGIRNVGEGELEKVLASQMGIRQQGMSELSSKAATEGAYADRVFGQAATGANISQSQAQAQAAETLRARQQKISEDTYTRNLPINEIATLMGTGQIAMPSFNAPPAVNVANTDLSGNVYNSADLAMQAYKAQQEAKSSALGGLAGMAGTMLGGPLGGALGSSLFG